MWQVTPSFALPEPYKLHEDTTGVYLVTDDEIVAMFTHYATPEGILRAVNEHRNGVAM
jgi:hypothetical protein